MDKLNNEEISDNEKRKSVKVTSEEISSISLAGRDFKIAPNTDFDFSITPRRCYVLCLSNKGNSTDLYELFDADICIAINVVEMVEMINNANSHLGIRVVSGDIKYYTDSIDLLSCASEDDAAFLKPAKPYQREAEYRIAIFWPKNEDSKLHVEKFGYINVFGTNPAADDHMTLSFQCPEFSQVVVDVQRI